MSQSPSAKYLTGYLVRAILGTALVLCAISAARTLLLAPHIKRAAAPTWEKLLELPDQLIDLCFAKFKTTPESGTVPGIATTGTPEPDPQSPFTSTALPASPFVPSTVTPSTGTAPPNEALTALPAMPGMPEMPSKPGIPTVPSPAPPSFSTPTTPDTSADAVAWGVATAPETRVYSPQGKLLGNAPAGSLLKVLDRHATAEEEIVVCEIMLNGRRLPKAVVRASEAAIYKGKLSDTSAEERAVRIRHACLLADISARETELKGRALGNNPHRTEYREVAQEYRALAKEANSLKADYEKATGAKRMKIADRLRELKLSEGRVLNRYKDAKKKYSKWKTEHPPREVDLSADPQLRQLQQQLAMLEQQIASR